MEWSESALGRRRWECEFHAPGGKKVHEITAQFVDCAQLDLSLFCDAVTPYAVDGAIAHLLRTHMHLAFDPHLEHPLPAGFNPPPVFPTVAVCERLHGVERR